MLYKHICWIGPIHSWCLYKRSCLRHQESLMQVRANRTNHRPCHTETCGLGLFLFRFILLFWENPTYLIRVLQDFHQPLLAYFILSLFPFPSCLATNCFLYWMIIISETLPGCIHTWKSTCLLLLVLSFRENVTMYPFPWPLRNLSVSHNKNEPS